MTGAIGNFLGIDPGQSGGFAILTPDGVALAFAMPKTEADIARLFKDRIVPAGIVFCLIEAVHSFPGQGVASSFKFGRNAGFLIGQLLAHEIPHEEMPPRTWQKALGIPPRRKRPRNPKPMMQYPAEESHAEFKNRLKSRAQALFPGLANITLATADALLIAETARRIQVGYQGRGVA